MYINLAENGTATMSRTPAKNGWITLKVKSDTEFSVAGGIIFRWHKSQWYWIEKDKSFSIGANSVVARHLDMAARFARMPHTLRREPGQPRRWER